MVKQSKATDKRASRLNAYEQERLKRIAENKKALANLGVHAALRRAGLEKVALAAGTSSSSKTRRRVSKRGDGSGRRGGGGRRYQSMSVPPTRPTRESRRLRGWQPKGVAETSPENKGRENGSGGSSYRDFEKERAEREKQADAELLARWLGERDDIKCAGIDANGMTKGEKGEGRTPQLFLIPTGLPGVNDHALLKGIPTAILNDEMLPLNDDEEQHNDDDDDGCSDTEEEERGKENKKKGKRTQLKNKKNDVTFLWGFCRGLYSRIFRHIHPGDIMLFTSSGSGKFNLVAKVQETRVVSHATSDRIWVRDSFGSGTTSTIIIVFSLSLPLSLFLSLSSSLSLPLSLFLSLSSSLSLPLSLSICLPIYLHPWLFVGLFLFISSTISFLFFIIFNHHRQSRMSFSMGGTAKNGVSFPLVVLLNPPTAIEWEKMEVMRLLG